jgi:hypothetical protein
MSLTDKISVKEIGVGIVLLAIIAVAMFFTLGVFNAESGHKVVEISTAGDKEANHVEALVKLLSIDPNKGDVSARIEFAPSDSMLESDGTLKQDLKLFVNSANGKQEVDFAKGKRMTPVEAVFNMYDGSASQYPFDKYSTEIDLWITKGKPAEKKKADAKPAPAEEPKETDGDHAATAEEAESDELPISVDFLGSISGYDISAAKAKYSDESYVGIETKIDRSSTVVFFSMFVGGLMWLLTIGVLFLVISLFARGRKVEIAMFSFTGALLFGFYAIRNSQPNIPAIGVYSDFLAYIWCEVIIGLCLAVCVIAWVLRPTK